MHSPLHECYKFHSKAVLISHPYITTAHTFQSLNASKVYLFQLPWYFQIRTDHWKYRSLLWFQFFYFILDDPIFPCHFPKVLLHMLASSMALTAKGWKGHNSQPFAQANWRGEAGDSSKLSFWGKERTGPSWLAAVVSPQPSSCCLQLEIIYVNRMGIELLIKKLGSKMLFSSFNLSRVGFPVPVSFSSVMIHII